MRIPPLLTINRTVCRTVIADWRCVLRPIVWSIFWTIDKVEKEMKEGEEAANIRTLVCALCKAIPMIIRTKFLSKRGQETNQTQATRQQTNQNQARGQLRQRHARLKILLVLSLRSFLMLTTRLTRRVPNVSASK
uniref:Uncharacterized protein n=1 Tax=Cacopsylla melanoneura TaxID=428564 RepID=A0A8D8V9N9_9HEMI